jgi:hypothetical protein
VIWFVTASADAKIHSLLVRCAQSDEVKFKGHFVLLLTINSQSDDEFTIFLVFHVFLFFLHQHNLFMVTIFTPLVHHTIHLSPPIHQLYAGSAFGLTLPQSSHFISIIDERRLGDAD